MFDSNMKYTRSFSHGQHLNYRINSVYFSLEETTVQVNSTNFYCVPLSIYTAGWVSEYRVDNKTQFFLQESLQKLKYILE